MEDNQILYDEVLTNKIEDIKNGLDKEDMFYKIQEQEKRIKELENKIKEYKEIVEDK